MKTDRFTEALLDEAARLDAARDTEQLDAMRRHYELIRRWNPRVRLTASTDPERAARELFADTLAASSFIDACLGERAEAALSVIDIGAGAGLPGVPLKVLHPAWSLTIVEANTKKIAFLKELTRSLGLQGIRISLGRAETLGHDPRFREQFDLALCRAVASPPIACELAVPFLKIGGTYIAQTGERAAESLPSAVGMLGATLYITSSYTITTLSSPRRLTQIIKQADTPPQFPRDPKTIKKQSLA